MTTPITWRNVSAGNIAAPDLSRAGRLFDTAFKRLGSAAQTVQDQDQAQFDTTKASNTDALLADLTSKRQAAIQSGDLSSLASIENDIRTQIPGFGDAIDSAKINTALGNLRSDVQEGIGVEQTFADRQLEIAERDEVGRISTLIASAQTPDQLEDANKALQTSNLSDRTKARIAPSINTREREQFHETKDRTKFAQDNINFRDDRIVAQAQRDLSPLLQEGALRQQAEQRAQEARVTNVKAIDALTNAGDDYSVRIKAAKTDAEAQQLIRDQNEVLRAKDNLLHINEAVRLEKELQNPRLTQQERQTLEQQRNAFNIANRENLTLFGAEVDASRLAYKSEEAKDANKLLEAEVARISKTLPKDSKITTQQIEQGLRQAAFGVYNRSPEKLMQALVDEGVITPDPRTGDFSKASARRAAKEAGLSDSQFESWFNTFEQSTGAAATKRARAARAQKIDDYKLKLDAKFDDPGQFQEFLNNMFDDTDLINPDASTNARLYYNKINEEGILTSVESARVILAGMEAGGLFRGTRDFNSEKAGNEYKLAVEKKLLKGEGKEVVSETEKLLRNRADIARIPK